MNDPSSRVAFAANLATYTEEETRRYVDGAPHLKHASVRQLYQQLSVGICREALEHSFQPRILDIGAGEGSATLLFLKMGAQVTAVDLSVSQLQELCGKCNRFADRLEVRQEDVNTFLTSCDRQFDVVVANSFLHHVPDYLPLIRNALRLLTEHGLFFSFQDPLRYDTLSGFTYVVSTLGYFSWRMFQGDVWGGLKRRWRRTRGIYLPDCPQDNTEYHVTRNGVDQDAIADLMRANGLECQVIRYFSTQGSVVQFLGAAAGLKNTFGIIGRRRQRCPQAAGDWN